MPENNFNATEAGGPPHVHPQTVRQRLRLPAELFGDDLRDPQYCFELETFLHARPSIGLVSGGLRGGRAHDVVHRAPGVADL